MAKVKRNWLQRQQKDTFVRQAHDAGYRSRAAYKLMELDKQEHLFQKGMQVIDLGAAPGSWSQVAAEKIGSKGLIIAVDLLEMQPLDGVQFIQGDFREAEIQQKLCSMLAKPKADLILSDMAPNLTGNTVVDQARSFELADLVVEFALNFLEPEGKVVLKIFQGVDFEDFLARVKSKFKKVKLRKPKASRPSSTEVYLVASSYN